jgi:hypothetical protein
LSCFYECSVQKPEREDQERGSEADEVEGGQDGHGSVCISVLFRNQSERIRNEAVRLMREREDKTVIVLFL